jgi:large subunit ribosomal protein L7/L12
MYALRTIRATNTIRSSALRVASKYSIAVRFNSTESTSAVDPKIQSIVDSISTLTLTETSSLIKALKSQLDIPDMAFPVGGSAVASAAPVDADAGDAAADAAPAAAEKTIFNIKLESFDAKTKAKVIKEVKGLLGLSLVDSKKFVESAPKVLKENVAKEDAEKIKKTLEDLGAKVTLE